MGEIVKFVAGLFLIGLLLVFAIPLLWGAIKLFIWLFGGLFIFIDGWVVLLIISIIAIIAMLSN